MRYELIYYKKSDKKKIKNIILSAPLKEIDKYIIKNNINTLLKLYQFIDCNATNIKQVLIVSKDNKKTRPILYLDDLDIIYNKDFLDNIYNLYVNDERFNNIFNNEILYPIINIKKDAKIKELAKNVITMYPRYSAFYSFYVEYFETKIEDEEDTLKTNFSYSKYRKFGEIYLDYIKSMDSKKERENKVYVKNK